VKYHRGVLLSAGDVAPDFEVSDHTGATRRLSEFRGKTVVLWFYPKANTFGWTAEGRGFRDLQKEFDSRGAQILGVSFDSVQSNAKFAEKQGFGFPLLCDTTRKVGMAYGACDSPDASSARRISYVIGPDGKVARVYGKVSPADHAREVLADLPASSVS
jgi:thioredoxin-dependent peroxiredoxin